LKYTQGHCNCIGRSTIAACRLVWPVVTTFLSSTVFEILLVLINVTVSDLEKSSTFDKKVWMLPFVRRVAIYLSYVFMC